MFSVNERSEDRLGHVVATRGKLIEDEMLFRDRGAVPVGFFLYIVQGARGERVIGDFAPVSHATNLASRGRQGNRATATPKRKLSTHNSQLAAVESWLLAVVA